MTDIAAARKAALATEPLRLAGSRPGFVTGTVKSVRDLIDHRQLLDRLVRRELKARYKDSSLGFVWSLIRPLAMLLIYFIALGKFLGAAGTIPSFAIFIYTGLTAWNLFNEIMLSGTGSIVANAGLIKKVYLPREIFPLASVGSSIFNFAIQLLILIGATIIVGEFPVGSRWLYFPLSFAVLVVFATAWALVLSAVNVYLRDIQYLVDVALMILFWASPIVYSWKLVSDHIGGTALETLYLANPMTLVVLGFQRAFWVAGDGQPVPDDLAGRLAITLVISVVFLWFAQRLFARLQANFAQEL